MATGGGAGWAEATGGRGGGRPPRGTLVCLCGLALSGKSTLAAALAEHLGAGVVAHDEINARRGLWGGDGLPAEEWAATHRAALAELAERMGRGERWLVADDSACFRFLRDDYRRLARRHGYRLRLVVVATPEAEVRRRLEALARGPQGAPGRPGRRGLDPEVFERHLASFEWPGDDEPQLTVVPGAGLDAWIDEQLAD